jgi:hypothetical protein
MTSWDHDTSLIPTRNEAILRRFLGRRLTRMARVVMNMSSIEAVWHESHYAKYGLGRSALFSTYDVPTLVVSDDLEIYVADAEAMCSVTIEPTAIVGIQDILASLLLLEAIDPVYADGSCALAIGLRIEAIDVYRCPPESHRTFSAEDLALCYRRRTYEDLVVFVLEGGRTLGFSRQHRFGTPSRVSLNPVIDPGHYTRIARFE